MTTRKAPRRGIAARWSFGVFLALLVALGVLIHHDVSPAVGTSPQGAVHAGHTTPGPAAPTASDTGTPGLDTNHCADPRIQHCTTAKTGAVQLDVPGRSPYDELAAQRHIEAERMPLDAVGRAPPDLSVLSQLRM